MFIGIDQGIKGAEDALNFLIAGGNLRVRKIVQCKGLREREDMFGPVISLQRFGNGVLTGFNAIITLRGSGVRIALPSHNRAENA